MLHGVSQTISTLFVRVHVEHLTYNLWEIALSFGITLFVALVAAFQPAREAMQVAPKEALEISYHGQQFKKSPKQIAWSGLICLVVVLPLSRLPGVLGMPFPAYVAILLLFVGFALLAPWLLEQLGHRISPGLRLTAGVPAFLAGRYLRDSGVRTAVSVGALITAVALYTALVIMIFSFRQTVELWVHQTVSGDLFLTTKMGDINRFRYTIDPEIVAKLQQIPADVGLVPSRRFQLTHNNFPYEFEIMGMESFLRHGAFVWLKGESDDQLALIQKGEGVLISEVFSNRTGLTVGDRYQAQIDTSRINLPILGVIRDYRTRGGIVFYDWHEFNRRFHATGWSGVRFYFRDQNQYVDSEVAKLRNLIIDCCGENLDMVSGKQLRQSVLRIFDETFAVTTVLLFIALVVAALGIATTLTVLVLERSRQLNTLLAVGAGFNQIRAMVFWEAGFMVIFGELGGLACGAVLSYLLVYVINKQSFGWTFIYGVDWGALGLSLPLIILTALAAALPAIKAAFREPPATLLKEI
jgi:putative ABC transport system permease protein